MKNISSLIKVGIQGMEEKGIKVMSKKREKSGKWNFGRKMKKCGCDQYLYTPLQRWKTSKEGEGDKS